MCLHCAGIVGGILQFNRTKILPVPYKLSAQDTNDHRRLQGVFEE